MKRVVGRSRHQAALVYQELDQIDGTGRLALVLHVRIDAELAQPGR